MGEINAVASKYSSAYFGGASCTNIEEDTRSRYVKLGNLYDNPIQTKSNTNTASPYASPPRKKANNKSTPERSLSKYSTPSTGSQASSVSTIGSTTSSFVRYDPEFAQYSQAMNRMTTELEGLRTQMAAMNTSVNNIETRQSELDLRVDNLTAKVQTSSQLKAVLRTIKQTANGLVSSRQRIQLLTTRLGTTGDADILLQLNLERTKESELTSNLADLREDARELAEADNTVLADDQLRLDV